MLEALKKNWWLVALRGLVALILGIIILVIPQAAATFLVIFIGIYALVDGVFALIVAVVNKPDHKDRWWLLFEGIVGILAGAAVLASPLVAAVILIYVIASWALLTGILEIIFAIAQWNVLPDKWLLLLGGIFSALLGIGIFGNVGFGAVLIITMIAVYMVLFGVVLIALGFSLKNSGNLLSGAE
jgi:uncharacterized membrane protein HdeD (DUF308 family)